MTQTIPGSDYTDNRLTIFNTNFYKLAQQKQSRLMSSPCVIYAPSTQGFTHSMARMGKVELADVSGQRNPDKQYTDFATDNRIYNISRFTRTILIDKKVDINELIADPTSDIYSNMVNAQNRISDRIIAAAAIGDVKVGTSDSYTLVTAVNDGVKTVNATSGLTSAKIDEITQNWINADFDYEEFSNSRLLLTGQENTALMGQTNFISNDYTNNRPVDMGVQKQVGLYGTIYYAGSVTGGTIITNPMLSEVSTTRTCIAMMPRSVEVCSRVDKLEVKESATKVNSMEVTIDYWIGAMRLEGAKVQKLTTTF
jgi:hypothetical protein